jgi:hypothetical protein
MWAKQSDGRLQYRRQPEEFLSSLAGFAPSAGSGKFSVQLARPAATGVAGAGQTVSTRFYLRAAQAYMLISMPTGTSTIFGVFQLIRVLPSRLARPRAVIETRLPSNVAQARNIER